MLLIVLFLLVAAVACVAFRRLRGAIAVICIAAGLLIAAGTAPVAGFLVRSLQDPFVTDVPARWGDNALIVLLGEGTERAGETLEVGGFSQGRLLKALELYRACRAAGAKRCSLLVSGGDPQAHGEAEADVYGRRLVELGIAPADLLLETTSRNTWENAKFAQPLIAQVKPDKIFVVTSGSHLARAMLYFRHFGTTVEPVRADYLSPIAGVLPNEFNLVLTALAIHEYIGIARYHIYQAVGWNDD